MGLVIAVSLMFGFDIGFVVGIIVHTIFKGG